MHSQCCATSTPSLKTHPLPGFLCKIKGMIWERQLVRGPCRGRGLCGQTLQLSLSNLVMWKEEIIPKCSPWSKPGGGYVRCSCPNLLIFSMAFQRCPLSGNFCQGTLPSLESNQLRLPLSAIALTHTVTELLVS